MRIGVISSMRGYAWAGSENLWLNLTRYAMRLGHSVSVILHEEMGAAPELQRAMREGLICRKWNCGSVARMERLRQVFAPNFSYARMEWPNVILVSLGSPTAVLAVPGLVEFLVTSKVPIVILLQFNAECLQICETERRLVREVFERAKCIIGVCRHNVLLLERQFNFPIKGKHLIVQNPIHVDCEEPLEFPDGEVLCLACVARLETRWKCQDILIDVLSEEKWRHRPVQLNLYGSGPDEAYLRDLIALRKGMDRIRLMGHEKNKLKIWRDNHALILPSRGEGTPLAALEAMKCGRPVISTRAGGLSEVVIDGLSGYLADSASVDGLDGALERAYATRDRWPCIGMVAHLQARAIAGYRSEEKIMEALEASVASN